MLLENLWIILAITAAALAYSYYVIKNTPERFKATAVLSVNLKGSQQVIPIRSLDENYGAYDPAMINFLAAKIGTPEVARETAKNTLQRFENGKLDESHAAVIKGWLQGVPETNHVETVMKHLGGARASERRGSRFIDVSVSHAEPLMAQMIANEFTLGFVSFKKSSRAGFQTNAVVFLQQEIPRLRLRLDEEDASLAAFLRTNPIASGQEDLVSTELRNINERLVALKSQKVQLEADWEQVEKVRNDPQQLLLIQSVAKSPRIASLRNQIQIQENNIVNLEQRYRAKHPKMIEAKNFLQSLSDSIEKEALDAPRQLELGLKNLQRELTQLEVLNKEYEKEITEKNVNLLTYNRLKNAADSTRKLYQSAVIRLDEIRILQAKDQDADYQVSVFSLARRPGRPYQPDPQRIIMLHVGIGLALSLGIIYFLHLLDTTIKSVDQAERMFGIPVLGSIPRSSDIRGDKQRLILSADPNSLCAEAFRTLRAAISLLGREDERRVTLFTSAVPAEGKTFCSANFALASANQGRKTLIVDFDLRRPSVGETFGIPSEQIGVSDCLLGKATIEDAAVVTEYQNLHVMSAGTMVPNPSELISSKHTPEFIALAKEKYDQVVLDNAPVTAVSDTLLILHYVDTVCLVSRAAKTSYRLVGRALELIRRGGVSPSGLVLNFVPQRGRTGYYYYYYSNKNYYGGYGQDRKKKKSKAAY